MPGAGAPDDETFWEYVRSEFGLAPELTNLVSVVRGNFTKTNREIAFNEATRLNRLPDACGVTRRQRVAPREAPSSASARVRLRALTGAQAERHPGRIGCP